MQIKSILASLMLAATVAANTQVNASNPDTTIFDTTIHGTTTTIDFENFNETELAIYQSGLRTTQKDIEARAVLEARYAKDCIARACECNFSSGRRCAVLTNQYGFCDACPDSDPDDSSFSRSSVDCISVFKWVGRHKC